MSGRGRGAGRAAIGHSRRVPWYRRPATRKAVWWSNAIALAVATLIVGTCVCVHARHRRLVERVRTRYVRTRCEVLSSEVHGEQHAHRRGQARPHEHNVYVPAVRYRYEVEGRTYESTEYSPTMKDTDDLAVASSIVARYQPGRPCECWYDPEHPEDAVLERE